MLINSPKVILSRSVPICPQLSVSGFFEETKKKGLKIFFLVIDPVHFRPNLFNIEWLND